MMMMSQGWGLFERINSLGKDKVRECLKFGYRDDGVSIESMREFVLISEEEVVKVVRKNKLYNLRFRWDYSRVSLEGRSVHVNVAQQVI